MKKILFILFLCISASLSATNYYVKTGGNDASAGTSDATAWASITKVNSFWAAGSFAPGDNIFFNRGDTFYGNLVISESGTLLNNITIGAYGSGADPIITGFTTISGWNNVGGGIYSKAISPESAPNMVTVDGVNTPIGRYPDTGWRTITTGGSSNIVDNTLSGTPDFDGAEVVIRKNRWIIDRCTGVNHSGTSISFTNASGYVAESGWGYFIQNHLSTLTTLGEWYYASGTLYMYFGAVDPTTKVVKVATLDELISIHGYDYIYLDNLSLQGANEAIVDIESSLVSSIYQCALQFSGQWGVKGNYRTAGASDSFTIDNSIVTDCNESAIDLWDDFSNATISNNTITNISTIPGMAGSGDGKSLAVTLTFADNGIIENNHISYCGYMPVTLTANNARAMHNFIHHYGYVKDDVGAIYTVTNIGYSFSGIEITDNVVMYGLGAQDGAYMPYGPIGYANGIYLDFNATGVLVSGNTAAYCALAGIYLHSDEGSVITDNTSFGNTYAQIYYNSDPNSGYIDLRTTTATGNKFISKGSGEYVAVAETDNTNDIPSFWTTSDYNYYTRPISETNALMTKIDNSQTERSLAGWISYTSQDANSLVSQGTAIVDTANINFIYNGTNLTKSFNLSQAMDDVANATYSGNISLAPYTSMVLLGAGDVTEGSDPPPNYPTVTTAAISGIGDVSATGGGNVTDDGGGTITARGVCWATTIDPTTADDFTEDGTGTGVFTSSITGLTAETLYYVRAYATNATGTNYGDNVTFTASAGRILVIGGVPIVDATGHPILITSVTPPTPPATPLSSGVVGFWTLNETTGALEDGVGANDYTNSGAAQDATGKVGKAVDFNTNTDYLLKSSASLTLGTDEATISLWVDLDNLPVSGSVSLIEFTNETDWTPTFFLRINSAGLVEGVFTNTLNASAIVYTAAASIGTTGFTHIVLVNYGDGQPPKVFIDGVDATDSATNFAGSLKTIGDFLIVGNQDNYSSFAPDGIIDNITIWNRALNNTEVASVYSNENAGTTYPY